MDAPANMKYCDPCDKHILTSSFAKHLKSKLHLQNIGGVTPPESRPLPEPVEQQQPQAVPTFKKLARAKIHLSTRELEKEVAKRMINPYYFSERYERQYEVNLDRHHPNHIYIYIYDKIYKIYNIYIYKI